jgi:hypothetical protein
MAVARALLCWTRTCARSAGSVNDGGVGVWTDADGRVRVGRDTWGDVCGTPRVVRYVQRVSAAQKARAAGEAASRTCETASEAQEWRGRGSRYARGAVEREMDDEVQGYASSV